MAAGGSGGELARPEPTGYGHTDSEWVDDTGVSHPRHDLRHVNEDEYEPWDWGEARDERHVGPARRRHSPADEPGRLKPEPVWETRTEANMSHGGWKRTFFGELTEMAPAEARDLEHGADGVVRYQGKPVAMEYEGHLVVDQDRPPVLEEAVMELIQGARKRGLKIEDAAPEKLERLTRWVSQRGRATEPKGEGTMTVNSEGTRQAKSDGVSAGHKKIIDELLEKEDARPTGDAVRLAESNPRKDFARYHIPTDRGLKDVEIWGDRVKVRSEATYGFAKKSDDMDGLPDRVAPLDDDLPGEVPVDEVPVDAPIGEETDMEGEPADGLLLHVDVSVDAPDEMEEEEVISILDEVLRDPSIADQINERLADSGLSLSVLEVETYDEDECEEEGLEEELDELDDEAEIEVVEPTGDAVQEGSGCNPV